MRNIIALVIVGILAWQGYEHVRARSATPAFSGPTASMQQSPALAPEQSASFKCDGRTYCSQMTSCEEATFFLRNCPGTKMDGNNDGVPCEQQWCRR